MPYDDDQTVQTSRLDRVFDEPVNDRLLVHALWDVVLLVATVAAAYLVYSVDANLLKNDGLRGFLVTAAVLGFAAVGLGLSTRAAVPNLAVGPLTVASALFFGKQSGRGMLLATGLTLTVVGVIAVGLGVLVIGFRVPAWAASLGLGFGLVAWIQRFDTPIKVLSSYDPARHAVYWFGTFAGLAVLGGLLGMIGPVRRAVGAYRAGGDPARRSDGAVLAFLAILGSALFSAVAGVLLAVSAPSNLVTPQNGFDFTALALGAVLLGGTSAYGRRGGVLGTVLAATGLTLVLRLASTQNWRLSPLFFGGAAIVVGLLVTRLVEWLGRSRDDEEDEDLAVTAPAANWTPAAPAPQPATGTWSEADLSTAQPSALSSSRLDERWPPREEYTSSRRPWEGEDPPNQSRW